MRSSRVKSTRSQMLTDAFFCKPNYCCVFRGVYAVTCVRSIDSHVWLISVNGIQDGGGVGGVGVGRGGQTQVNAPGPLTYGDN